MRRNPVLVLALLIVLVFGAGQWVDRAVSIREKQAAEAHWQQMIALAQGTQKAVLQVNQTVEDFRVVKPPSTNLFGLYRKSQSKP